MAQAAEVSHRLGTFLNTDPDVFKKDAISFSGSEAKDMMKVAARAAFVAFWMDRDLLTLQDFKRHIPGNRLQLFRDLATPSAESWPF